MEARGAVDMGRRTVQAASAIFRFAIASGWARENPAANLHGALAARLRIKHRAMVAPKDMGEFLLALRDYSGEEATRLAIEAVVRTAVRTSGLRFGVWSEIEGDLWRLPSSRMKVEGVEHLIPLAPQVCALFERAKELGGGSPWLFPGERGQPMSQNTMIFGIYRLGWHSRATIHGFRRTFSTWANETGRWHPDAIERQLAHWPRDEVRAAYNAAEHLAARRELMAARNDWLDADVGVAIADTPG